MRASTLLAASALAAAHTPLLAQDADAPPPAPRAAAGTQTYMPGDFARFAPKTAFDMVR